MTPNRYVDEVGFDLILLPLQSKCWDYSWDYRHIGIHGHTQLSVFHPRRGVSITPPTQTVLTLLFSWLS